MEIDNPKQVKVEGSKNCGWCGRQYFGSRTKAFGLGINEIDFCNPDCASDYINNIKVNYGDR